MESCGLILATQALLARAKIWQMVNLHGHFLFCLYWLNIGHAWKRHTGLKRSPAP